MKWIASIFGKVAASPLFIYLKMALIAAAIAAAGTIAWKVRGAAAKVEQEKAVASAVAQANKDLAEERRITGVYRDLTDQRLAKLLQLVSNIKIENKTITNNIRTEAARDPKFYSQQLPEGGYKEWLRARALVAPAASAASSP